MSFKPQRPCVHSKSAALTQIPPLYTKNTRTHHYPWNYHRPRVWWKVTKVTERVWKRWPKPPYGRLRLSSGGRKWFKSARGQDGSCKEQEDKLINLQAPRDNCCRMLWVGGVIWGWIAIKETNGEDANKETGCKHMPSPHAESASTVHLHHPLGFVWCSGAQRAPRRAVAEWTWGCWGDESLQ